MSRSSSVRPAMHVGLVALGVGYLASSTPCAAQEDGETELGRHIMLLSGTVKGGSMKRNYFKINILGDPEPLEDHPLDGALLELGGMATYGFMPAGRSGFTMGGRIRAGGYVSEEFRGYLGSSLVLGSTVGPRVDRRYAYFLGGLGAEYLPSEMSVRWP